jgi:hypothetical protein
MKKKAATDGKKAAANDKPENGTAEKAKLTTSFRTVPPEPERYTIGSTETVKRGFLKEFCDFTKKKGTVDAAMLIAEFSGRQIDGKKITVDRVHRYISYCRNHGILKTVKAGGQ